MRSKLFRTATVKRPPRNSFDLSHEKKLSFQIGQLIPTLLIDVIPGDSFRVAQETLIRLQPLIAPLMHRVDVTTHFFFVPNRIICDNWEDFITGGSDGLDATVLPYFTLDNTVEQHYDKGKTSDYLGIPIPTAAITQDVNFSALPFNAYWNIYNEYYRDQNLQAELSLAKAEGDQSAVHSNHPSILQRSYEKDYFTSCLPWAQRGNQAEIDLDWSTGDLPSATFQLGTGGVPAIGAPLFTGADTRLEDSANADLDFDLTNIHAVLEVTELRRVVKLQEWLEKNAIAGSRHREVIYSHFGVVSDDARWDIPEYLGGGKTPVVISEVVNTAESLVPSSDAISQPQGSMAGHGISVGRTKGFQKSFKEHGWILGITSVLPRTAYMEGIESFWRKTDKTEIYWPEYANLGEQAVKMSEIFYDETGVDMDNTFGYQARYAEYKFKQDSVHGDFRDDFDDWHMTRIMGSSPTLNTSFVLCDSGDHDRNFAVTLPSVHKLFAQIFNDVQAIRPMPVYGTPSI